MADAVDRELQTAAEALNARHAGATGLQVGVAVRWRGPFRVQGLCVWDLWTDVFEAVRHRLLWTRTWHLRQAPVDAAANIDWFFAHRPDLPPDERPTAGTTGG